MIFLVTTTIIEVEYEGELTTLHKYNKVLIFVFLVFGFTSI